MRRLLKGVGRTSLVVQWLRVHAPNGHRPGSIPDQKTTSGMLQLNIPKAATKTQHSQKILLHFSLRIFLTLLPEYWPLPESEFLSASIWEHPRIKPVSPALEGRFLTTGQPGKPYQYILKSEAPSRLPSLSQEDPLEKEMATQSHFLAWEIPLTEGAWRAIVHGTAKSPT